MNKSTETVLEARIKSLVIDRLIKSKIIDCDAVVINEYSIDSYSRRADIAIITNNMLLAIEVKSEADNLSRLESQLQKYSQYFDKVIVVVAEKHLSKVLEMNHNGIEIWKINEKKITQVKRGKISRCKEKKKYFELLPKKELRKFFSAKKINNLPSTRAEFKSNIDNYLKDISLKEARAYAIDYLKSKYSQTSRRFLLRVKNNGLVNEQDLDLLSIGYKNNNLIKKSPSYLIDILDFIKK